MNDLTICKKIAEIEGLLVSEYKLGTDDLWVHTCNTRDSSVTLYSPLDDALWANLITKYEVSISFNFCLISMITDKQYEMNFTDIPSLKRKSLLLIIEAHKEQS